MHIVVNGEPIETAARTLDAILRERELDEAVVATAVNGDFVPVRGRATQLIAEGDRIEIVAPMQGG